MNLKIPRTELRLLLEKKKEQIGKTRLSVTEFSFAVALLTALLTSDFKDIFFIPAAFVRTIFIVLTLILFIMGIIHIFYNRYTYKNLIEDIEKLSVIPNEQRAVFVLKNDFSKYSNRFLVYRDRIWDCFLCPHSPMDSEGNLSEEYAARCISDEFNIPLENVKAVFVSSETDEKYSMRTGSEKIYTFSYFRIFISSFPPEMKKKNFTASGKDYSWKNIQELIGDNNSKERNFDVISFLESHKWG